MIDEIRFKLMLDNKVVGYERWNSLAGKWCYDTKSDGVFDIKNPFIPHTNKRRFSNRVDKAGKKLYEEDKIKNAHTEKPGKIVFSHIGNEQGWTGFWVAYAYDGRTSHWPFNSRDIELVEE